MPQIVAPGYSFLQETVGKALVYEQNRLITIARAHLTASEVDAVHPLLEDSPGLYEITQLKREPSDFSASEIKREISRGEQLHPLYQPAQRLLPELEMSNESVKYYASLVGYYSVYKLNRLNPWMIYVYLLGFVYHRYQRLYDNLINSLLYNVRRYDGLAPQFKRHLRPILLAVDFAASKARDPLREAIDLLKAAFRKGRPLRHYPPAALPRQLIPEGMKRYL